MSDSDGHPANPYAAEAATAQILSDREGYPFAARPRANLSGEAQLGDAREDEPTFVLRASDPLASQIVRLLATAAGLAGTPRAEVAAAWELARRMDEWRRRLEFAAAVDGGPTATVEGHVKFFDAVAGYGYVIPDRTDMGEVMLHRSTLRDSGYSQTIPAAGARIEVEAVQRPRGWKATRVLSIG